MPFGSMASVASWLTKTDGSPRLPPEETCEKCGKARHYLGRCPADVARERNGVIEEVAQRIDSAVVVNPVLKLMIDEVARAIREMKTPE